MVSIEDWYCYLLTKVDHGLAVFDVEDYGVSNTEYLVHLVHMNRLSACREF